MARRPLSFSLDDTIDVPPGGPPAPELGDYTPGEMDDPAAAMLPEELMPPEGIEVDLGEGGDLAPMEAEEEDDFDANLAETLDEDWLKNLAANLIEEIEQDIEDRKPWEDRFTRGLEMLGLVQGDLDDGPFPGASSVVHPLLVEAQVQFWARAYAELFPASGPAKSLVLGQRTQEREEAAARVEDFLNFEMVVQDEGFSGETSRLLLAVPFQGSAFRKTFRDPIQDITKGVYVSAKDIIAPWDTVDLKTAPRFVHRMQKTKNDVRKLQVAGFYRDIELPDPDDDEQSGGDAEAAIAETQDVEIGGVDGRRNTRILYECYVELSIPGHEDVDESGEETGIELPFIATIDVTSSKVLSIYRNWDPDDPLKRREVPLHKYDYVPGLGFYGNGLIHLIGGLQEAATGALRVLLDSAATASLPGGFVAKDARLSDDRLIYEPGVYKQVEASSDELAKAFWSPPVRDPSPVLYQMLDLLVNSAQRFTATTEMQVGESNRNQPVGTTLALLEQGQKVMTAIHRGLHATFASELRLRKKIAMRYVSDEGYPYQIAGDERQVFANDFANTDIVPVSDPNVVSTSQRVAMNQAAYELAMQNPDVMNKRVAIKRLLDGMKIPDVDELMHPEAEPVAYDAVGEIQAVLMGKPVMVMPQQQHLAYLQSWAAFLQNPGFGANDQVMQVLAPAIQTVVGQHLAYQWLTGAREAGVPAAPIDPMTGQPAQMEAPPEQINAMLMQIAPALAQLPGLPGGANKPDPAAEHQLKLKHKDEEHGQKVRHLEETHQTKMAIDVAEAKQKEGLRDVEAVQDIEKKSVDHEIDMQRKMDEAEIARQERIENHQFDMAQQAEQAQMKAAEQSQSHEQKLQESIDMATLTAEERQAQMVDDMAKREQDNAQRELDAHQQTQARTSELEHKQRLSQLAEMAAKKKMRKGE